MCPAPPAAARGGEQRPAGRKHLVRASAAPVSCLRCVHLRSPHLFRHTCSSHRRAEPCEAVHAMEGWTGGWLSCGCFGRCRAHAALGCRSSPACPPHSGPILAHVRACAIAHCAKLDDARGVVCSCCLGCVGRCRVGGGGGRSIRHGSLPGDCPAAHAATVAPPPREHNLLHRVPAQPRLPTCRAPRALARVWQRGRPDTASCRPVRALRAHPACVAPTVSRPAPAAELERCAALHCVLCRRRPGSQVGRRRRRRRLAAPRRRSTEEVRSSLPAVGYACRPCR